MCVHLGLTRLSDTEDFFFFFWTMATDSDSVTMDGISTLTTCQQTMEIAVVVGGAAESAIPLATLNTRWNNTL